MFIGDSTVNPLATQVTVSAIVVAFIQWLKSRDWFPWIQNEAATANRIAAVLLAALTAIGIHMTWSHGDVPGSYMISVTGLTLVGIGMGLYAIIKSFVFQELIYRTTVKNGSPPAAPAMQNPAQPAAYKP